MPFGPVPVLCFRNGDSPRGQSAQVHDRRLPGFPLKGVRKSVGCIVVKGSNQRLARPVIKANEFSIPPQLCKPRPYGQKNEPRRQSEPEEIP